MDKSHEEIKKGCERDIRLVDQRLRQMEKKMWSIFGGLAVISFIVSVPGQKIMANVLTSSSSPVIIEGTK